MSAVPACPRSGPCRARCDGAPCPTTRHRTLWGSQSRHTQQRSLRSGRCGEALGARVVTRAPLVQVWENPERGAVSASGAYGPHTMAIRRVPIPYEAMKYQSYLTTLLSYAAVALHCGPYEKLQRDRKLATGGADAHTLRCAATGSSWAQAVLTPTNARGSAVSHRDTERGCRELSWRTCAHRTCTSAACRLGFRAW
jgi:hypothetical protein